MAYLTSLHYGIAKSKSWKLDGVVVSASARSMSENREVVLEVIFLVLIQKCIEELNFITKTGGNKYG